MLVEKDIRALENYIMKSKEPQLFKWWAQYLESQGDTEEALRYYEMAKDYVSLVINEHSFFLSFYSPHCSCIYGSLIT